MNRPAYEKYSDGLVPAIVQDQKSLKILMVGFMNEEALEKTQKTKMVTFFSRSKQRLWTKGETSGNFLELKEMKVDCDDDAILIYATPKGVVCHKGDDTCFDETNETLNQPILSYLEKMIEDRKTDGDADKSYVSSLFKKGINKIAQKVGEEAVELVIEAKDDDEDLFLNEAADLLFHYLILLSAKGYTLRDVTRILEQRKKK